MSTDYHRFDQQYPIFVFGGPTNTPTALNNPRYFGLFYAEDFLIDEDYTDHSELGSPYSFRIIIDTISSTP